MFVVVDAIVQVRMSGAACTIIDLANSWFCVKVWLKFLVVVVAAPARRWDVGASVLLGPNARYGLR